MYLVYPDVRQFDSKTGEGGDYASRIANESLGVLDDRPRCKYARRNAGLRTFQSATPADAGSHRTSCHAFNAAASCSQPDVHTYAITHAQSDGITTRANRAVDARGAVCAIIGHQT